MKPMTIILTLLFTLPPLILAQNQVAQGRYSVTGGLSYTAQKYETEKKPAHTLIVNPAIHYFVRHRLALGLSVQLEDIQHSSYESTPDRRHTRSVSFGPDLRYYLGSHRFYPFFSVGVYRSFTQEHPSKIQYRRHEFLMGLGVDYFISPSLALEVTVNRHLIRDRSTWENPYGGKGEETYNASQMRFMVGFYAFLF